MVVVVVGSSVVVVVVGSSVVVVVVGSSVVVVVVAAAVLVVATFGSGVSVIGTLMFEHLPYNGDSSNSESGL